MAQHAAGASGHHRDQRPLAIEGAPLDLALAIGDHGDHSAPWATDSAAPMPTSLSVGGARIDRAKTNMLVVLLWELCKAKVDGVQLFAMYITQLVAANVVEPEVAHQCMTGDFGALAADLFETVPGAADWATQAVPRGVSTAVGIPSSPTKMLQRLQSSLADSRASTRYEEMFEEYEELGRGGFGSIARVQHRADLKFYAVKKIRCRLPKQQLDERGGLNAYLHSRILREAQVICQMDHPHIVRYYNTWVEVRWTPVQNRRGRQRWRRPQGSSPRGGGAAALRVPSSPRAGAARGGAARTNGGGAAIQLSVDRTDISSVDTASSSSSSPVGSSPSAVGGGGGSGSSISINSFSDDLSGSISSGPVSAGAPISISSSSKDKDSPSPRAERESSGGKSPRSRSPVTPVPESDINSQGSGSSSLDGQSSNRNGEHRQGQRGPTTLRVAVHEDSDSSSSSSSSSSAATSIDSDYSAISSVGGGGGGGGGGAVPNVVQVGTDIIVRQNPFENLMALQPGASGTAAGAAAGGSGSAGGAGGGGGGAGSGSGSGAGGGEGGGGGSSTAHRTNQWVENLEGNAGHGQQHAVSDVLTRQMTSGELATLMGGGLEGNVEIYIQMELCHAHSLAERLRLGAAKTVL
jgi:hypothetical protein